MEGKLEGTGNEIVTNGISDATKMDAGVQTDQGNGKAKTPDNAPSWLTTIPEKYRAKVDTGKYNSLDALFEDLLSGKPEAGTEGGKSGKPEGNDESDKAWEEFFRSAEGNEQAKAIGKLFRDSGVKEPSIFVKLGEITSKGEKEQAMRMTAAFKKGVEGIWGEDSEANIAEYNNYVKALEANDKEAYNRVVGSGVVLSPDYANAIVELQKLRGEKTSPKGTVSKKGTSGTYGFKTLI